MIYSSFCDGFSDCLGPDEDMQAELDRDYPEDQPGFISKVTDKYIKKGYHSVVWDGVDNSSGIYFVKMISGEFINTQKIMLVK